MPTKTKARKKSMEVRQRHFWLNEPHDKPLLDRPIFVDGFAGGGGASQGIYQALGRHVDVAINHDRDAIGMHMKNHPQTKHYCENIWNVDPVEACEGRPLGAAWFSPDCTHFSKARGKAPVKKEIRGLAQAIIPWASMDKALRPRVIFVENVAEFQTWGPIDDAGQPIKARAGETFQLWIIKLQELGYAVEYRELVASDYGAPTTRKRLFIIARCDGRPIVWPAPTHGSPKQIAQELKTQHSCRRKPWRTAAEIIDWSIPCPSIFLTRPEAKAAGCNRPLADKTLARIAEGIRRYVIQTADPFIVTVNHGGAEFRGQEIDRPLGTSTHKNGWGFVVPHLVSYYGPKTGGSGGRGRSIDEPLATVTTENRFGLVAPIMVQTGYGERSGQSPRCLDLGRPIGTIVAGGGKCAVVSAFVAKHFGGVVGIPADRPFPTVTTIGTQNQIVAASLVKHNHGEKQAFAVDEPLRTVCAGGGHHAVVETRLQQVRAFLFKYFGTGGAIRCDYPVSTLTTKDRLALGIVLVQGEPWQIVDIGMRMLSPRELFLAQGFPSTYIIDHGEHDRPLSKSAQVARCGNSVPPPFAEALVRANCPEMCRHVNS